MLKSFFCGSIIAASLWSSNAVAIANDKGYIDITAGEILYPMILEEYNGKKCLVGKGIGLAEYEFTISDSGIYYFWGKAMGGDPHSNSFIVTVDEEQPVIWEIPVKKDGITAWFKIKSFTNATGEFKLKSGQHKLVIKSREAGARLEAIFIGKKEISPENSQSRQ